jgi:hypothetical protein
LRAASRNDVKKVTEIVESYPESLNAADNVISKYL